MADIADLYQQLRVDISDLVRGLSQDQLQSHVPATPAWTIRDVVAHLAADAAYVGKGDFPEEFFQSFGDAAAVVTLNEWTARQVAERRDRSLDELLEEWEACAGDVESMMRGTKPWPDGVMVFADRVLLTDEAVHQQDIFGALGVERERESAPIKLALSGYIVTMGWRLGAAGLPPLRFNVGDKTYSAGEGDPGAEVSATRWEFFRAMSGRRSPDQIKALSWNGDPEPYVPYFYPYGIRQDALVE